MNVDEIIIKNKLLEEELQKTKDELINTKEHLTPSLIQNAPFGGCYEWRRWCRLRIFNAQRCKKYTAPASRKIYYEKNREIEKQRAKEYKEKTNYKSTPEQT